MLFRKIVLATGLFFNCINTIKSFGSYFSACIRINEYILGQKLNIVDKIDFALVSNIFDLDV